VNEPNATVTLSREDGRGTIHLSRGRGNAINDQVLDEMMQALQEAERDPEVKGVVMSAGGKMFCPGLDLHHLTELDRQGIREFMRKFSACNLKMFTFPKPMIAALSGHALAGGLVFALNADWRILQNEAMVGLNELKVGVPLPFGVSIILRDAVSGPRLEEIALFGRNYKGEQAVQVGLVHELCDSDKLDALAIERLDEMTSRDPNAFAVTKRYLRAATVERIRSHDAMFQNDFVECWFSDGTQARIHAIVGSMAKKGS
jgi:enoyl-CoA hydratase/carnithine racemase